jgi:2,4-dienoyl-CoA reductase-like NADH-dependent reductase (Old Yellow Enzyme family)
MTKLFERFSLAQGITLRNRVVMAPMTTWSANDDRTISDQEDAYYRRRVKGVGLVITGCSHVSPSGIGFTDEFASYDDRFVPSLRRLADAAKSGGARAVLQIFHAGNRAVPELIPGGDVVSASALTGEPSPFAPCEIPARALTHAEILAIVADFGQATRRAIEAGFDGVELHGAHSFLIQNFLSPRYNQRTDVWGGSAENRMRFPLAVVHEVKRVIAAHASAPLRPGLSPLARGGRGGRPAAGRAPWAWSTCWSKPASTTSMLRWAACWRAGRSATWPARPWPTGSCGMWLAGSLSSPPASCARRTRPRRRSPRACPWSPSARAW